VEKRQRNYGHGKDNQAPCQKEPARLRTFSHEAPLFESCSMPILGASGSCVEFHGRCWGWLEGRRIRGVRRLEPSVDTTSGREAKVFDKWTKPLSAKPFADPATSDRRRKIGFDARRFIDAGLAKQENKRVGPSLDGVLFPDWKTVRVDAMTLR